VRIHYFGPQTRSFVTNLSLSLGFICVDPCASVVSNSSVVPIKSKQAALLARGFEAKVIVGQRGGDTSARRAVEKAKLH